ncbi:MAG: sulfatase-like hydrolase/transferase [Planctomycetota bacterium]
MCSPGCTRARVEFLDHEIGNLVAAIDRLGLAEQTYIGFTSDHGEAFGEHGFYGHGMDLHEEQLRVPLFLAGPELEPGVVGDPVENRRLFATVLDLAGLDLAAAPRPGCSALPRATSPRSAAPVFAMTAKGVCDARKLDQAATAMADSLATFYSVATARWKLIASQPLAGGAVTPVLLYDLTADPGEHQEHRIDSEPAVREQLARTLSAWRASCAQHAIAAFAGELSARSAELLRLKGVGYLGR